MQRTKVATLVLLALVAALVGWVLVLLLAGRGDYLPKVPYAVGAVLVVIAAVVFWLGLAVRAFQRGKRPSLSPFRAARTAMVAKAAALTGALLAGWYAGQVLAAIGDLRIEAQRERVIAAAVALVCAVVLAVVGLIVERFCQLPPPSEGEEKRRGEGPALGDSR